MPQVRFLDSMKRDKYGPRGFEGGGDSRDLKPTRVASMADGTRGKDDRNDPPDDEAALSARLQRLGNRLAPANRPPQNDTRPRPTADPPAIPPPFPPSTQPPPLHP